MPPRALLNRPSPHAHIGPNHHYGGWSERGARVAALFYSLIESAKLAGVEPQTHLGEATLQAVRYPGTATLPQRLEPSESREEPALEPLGAKTRRCPKAYRKAARIVRRADRCQSALVEAILGRYKAEVVRRNEPERKVEALELAARERIDLSVQVHTASPMDIDAWAVESKDYPEDAPKQL